MDEKRGQQLPQEWAELLQTGIVDRDEIEWAIFNEVSPRELVAFHNLYEHEKKRHIVIGIIMCLAAVVAAVIISA